jgi:hypothetical protein
VRVWTRFILLVVAISEYSNEPLSFIKCREFVQLSGWVFLQDCLPCSFTQIHHQIVPLCFHVIIYVKGSTVQVIAE